MRRNPGRSKAVEIMLAASSSCGDACSAALLPSSSSADRFRDHDRSLRDQRNFGIGRLLSRILGTLLPVR